MIPSNSVTPDRERSPKITDIYSKDEVLDLWMHQHNNNPELYCGMAFRGKEGDVCYRRSKKKPASILAKWALNTVLGNVEPGWEVAFVPYSRNADGLSCWAAFDFDAHDGNGDRALRLATAALERVQRLEPDLPLLLEDTGGGGFHLWLITKAARPCAEWIALLTAVAAEIGTPIQPGICEIFPKPATSPIEFGSGMRAPGTWNPRTATCGEVLSESLGPLIAEIRSFKPNTPSGTFPKKEKSISSSFSLLKGACSTGLPSSEEEIGKEKAKEQTKAGEACSDPSEARGFVKLWANWRARFQITEPSTRNANVCELAGDVFHRVSREIACRMAEAQFNEKTVWTRAPLAEHLRDFSHAWSGLVARWVWEELSAEERTVYGQLCSQTEQDLFRIVRSFHRHALHKNDRDFPIVQTDMADRLGVTAQRVSQLLRGFISAGILELSQEHVPRKSAARYRWLLPSTTQSPEGNALPATGKASADLTVDTRPQLKEERHVSARTEAMMYRARCSRRNESDAEWQRLIGSEIIGALKARPAFSEEQLACLFHPRHLSEVQRVLQRLARSCRIHRRTDGEWRCGPKPEEATLAKLLSTMLKTVQKTQLLKGDIDSLRTLATTEDQFSDSVLQEAWSRLAELNFLTPDGRWVEPADRLKQIAPISECSKELDQERTAGVPTGTPLAVPAPSVAAPCPSNGCAPEQLSADADIPKPTIDLKHSPEKQIDLVLRHYAEHGKPEVSANLMKQVLPWIQEKPDEFERAIQNLDLALCGYRNAEDNYVKGKNPLVPKRVLSVMNNIAHYSRQKTLNKRFPMEFFFSERDFERMVDYFYSRERSSWGSVHQTYLDGLVRLRAHYRIRFPFKVVSPWLDGYLKEFGNDSIQAP